MSAEVLTRAVAVIANDAGALEQIRGDAQIAVWRRVRPAALAWLDGHELAELDDMDLPIAVERLDAHVALAMAQADYPMGEGGRALASDVVALAQAFAAIMGCDHVKLRLQVVETDACRKFHMDMVTARLLTTYAGPGTQWIEAAAPDEVKQLAPGEIALLKGRRWVEEPEVLHRSPPISGTGDTRLLLAIDPHDPVAAKNFD